MQEEKDWFSIWFDTKYYHILYQNRDYHEAELFINNLVSFLSPSVNSSFLDLACGKGRHSIYLNKQGFKVLGSDLSEQSILKAKEAENETLKFLVGDMREEIKGFSFDYIFNLFTSFGYFDNAEDDQKVINSVYNMLNTNGVFVLDYLNVEKLFENLVPFEIKELDGIQFEIKRFLESGFVKKEITFVDKKEKYHFREQVKMLDMDDFENLFKKAKLKDKTRVWRLFLKRIQYKYK